jgi:DNA-binding transcriptional regulator YhcF (GntR family)
MAAAPLALICEAEAQARLESACARDAGKLECLARGPRVPTAGHTGVQRLRERMEAGEFPPDAWLPSKTELMNECRVAPGTVNNAIGVLREMGFAETIQGAGMFARMPLPPNAYTSDAMAARVEELESRMARLQEMVDLLHAQMIDIYHITAQPYPLRGQAGEPGRQVG